MKEELRKMVDEMSDREICNIGVFGGIIDASTETAEDIRHCLYNMFENVEELNAWMDDLSGRSYC